MYLYEFVACFVCHFALLYHAFTTSFSKKIQIMLITKFAVVCYENAFTCGKEQEIEQDAPTRPNSSTPRAAKMKNRRKKRRPRLLTSGSACMTVSSSVRTDCAIFSSFSTTHQRTSNCTKSSFIVSLRYDTDVRIFSPSQIWFCRVAK